MIFVLKSKNPLLYQAPMVCKPNSKYDNFKKLNANKTKVPISGPEKTKFIYSIKPKIHEHPKTIIELYLYFFV